MLKFLSLLLIVALVYSQDSTEDDNDVTSNTEDLITPLNDSTTSTTTRSTSVTGESTTTNVNNSTKPSPVQNDNGIDFPGNKPSFTFDLNKFRPVYCTPTICLHRCLAIMDPPIKATCSGVTCKCEGNDELMMNIDILKDD